MPVFKVRLKIPTVRYVQVEAANAKEAEEKAWDVPWCQVYEADEGESDLAYATTIKNLETGEETEGETYEERMHRIFSRPR